METIIAAAISGGLALIGVIVTVNKGNQKFMHEIKAEFSKAQAVTDEKIKELTREVREHNNFAKRMPVVEQRIEAIDEKIKILHSDKL